MPTVDSIPTLLHGELISEELIAAIAQQLDSNKVPNVLWGFYLLEDCLTPAIIEDVGFVVPDQDLMVARTVLCDAGLELCENQACVKVKGWAPADEHFHFGRYTCLYLYRQSRTLFNVADLSVSPTHAPAEADIIYSSSPGLPKRRLGYPSCPFHTSLYPVRIPTVRCLTEAYLLNLLREVDGVELPDHEDIPLSTYYWLTWIFVLVRDVYKVTYGTKWCSPDLLQPRFQDLIKTLISKAVPFRVAVNRLIASEREKGDSKDI